jgi:hypothetical protein
MTTADFGLDRESMRCNKSSTNIEKKLSQFIWEGKKSLLYLLPQHIFLEVVINCLQSFNRNSIVWQNRINQHVSRFAQSVKS